MFVTIPGRERTPFRWATPALFSLLWLCFIAVEVMPGEEQRRLLTDLCNNRITEIQFAQRRRPFRIRASPVRLRRSIRSAYMWFGMSLSISCSPP